MDQHYFINQSLIVHHVLLVKKMAIYKDSFTLKIFYELFPSNSINFKFFNLTGSTNSSILL